MTEHGEVMMQNSQPKNDFDIGWILPVCRLQDELGMGVEYQTGGKTFLVTPDGDRLELKRYLGL
eukprot:4732114-Lingulodinium_polyedra.AAC.1